MCRAKFKETICAKYKAFNKLDANIMISIINFYKKHKFLTILRIIIKNFTIYYIIVRTYLIHNN